MELCEQVFGALKGLGNVADKKLRAPQDPETGRLLNPFKQSNQILFDDTTNETLTWINVNDTFVARALFTSAHTQCIILHLPCLSGTGTLNSGDSWFFLKPLENEVAIAFDAKAPYKLTTACYAQIGPSQDFTLKNLSSSHPAKVELMRHIQI